MMGSASSTTSQKYITLLKAEQIKRVEGERRFVKLSKCKDELITELIDQLQKNQSQCATASEATGDLTDFQRLAICKDALIKESINFIDSLAERELDERTSKSQYRCKTEPIYQSISAARSALMSHIDLDLKERSSFCV